MAGSACASGAASPPAPTDAAETAHDSTLPAVPGTSPNERLARYAGSALVLVEFEAPALRERLGQPDSTASRPTPNRHVPGQLDSLVTLHYAGLTLELYRTATGRDLLQRVDVSANRWLRWAPGIGAGEPVVLAALGQPLERTDSTLTFLCATCGPVEEPITFLLGDGRVRRVSFHFYVD